jgi:hypothetical protein
LIQRKITLKTWPLKPILSRLGAEVWYNCTPSWRQTWRSWCWLGIMWLLNITALATQP